MINWKCQVKFDQVIVFPFLCYTIHLTYIKGIIIVLNSMSLMLFSSGQGSENDKKRFDRFDVWKEQKLYSKKLRLCWKVKSQKKSKERSFLWWHCCRRIGKIGLTFQNQSSIIWCEKQYRNNQMRTSSRKILFLFLV